ncbi:BnaA09g11830D [Brassica napus]|uniref:BnaA09g11830D protein n=1 Tax=Brassica napus TaxID=3708 RepID=A0A078HKN5_BRANA|nr:BnaA09g11830D [Brassica napus]
MSSKMKTQKLSTSSETADLPVTKIIASPSLSKKELQKAMKKQNDADLVLTGKVIASKARNSNFNVRLSSTRLLPSLLLMVRRTVAPRSRRLTVFGSSNHFRLIIPLRISWRMSSRLLSLKLTSGPRLNKCVESLINGLQTRQMVSSRIFFLLDPLEAIQIGFMETHCTSRELGKINSASLRRKKEPFTFSMTPQCLDIKRSFSMYFYLPDENDGLDNLVKKMTSTPGFVDNHTPTCRVKLDDFAIPKFKISFGFEASKALYHKACVEIDEEGAEAAAASFCERHSYTPNRNRFVADHPFLFLIREDTTGTVLFAGQIFDPSKSS